MLKPHCSLEQNPKIPSPQGGIIDNPECDIQQYSLYVILARTYASHNFANQRTGFQNGYYGVHLGQFPREENPEAPESSRSEGTVRDLLRGDRRQGMQKVQETRNGLDGCSQLGGGRLLEGCEENGCRSVTWGYAAGRQVRSRGSCRGSSFKWQFQGLQSIL